MFSRRISTLSTLALAVLRTGLFHSLLSSALSCPLETISSPTLVRNHSSFSDIAVDPDLCFCSCRPLVLAHLLGRRRLPQGPQQRRQPHRLVQRPILQPSVPNLSPSPSHLLIHLFANAEGTTEYTTCAGLLTASSSTWPNTALFQIAASGVPLSKLVIGKPATTGDASNGYMSTSTLASCVSQAKNEGWSASASLFPSRVRWRRLTLLSRGAQLVA